MVAGFFQPGSAVAGPIYVVESPDGSTRFTSKKPPDGVRAKIFSAKEAHFSWIGSSRSGGKLFLKEYRDIILHESRKNGLAVELVQAVIHAESRFNPYAKSKKGAEGLMQLMPVVQDLMKVKDPYSPTENIRAGCRYLAQLLSAYNGNERLSLAAYNAGPGAVAEHRGVPPYKETTQYVTKVLELKRRYGDAGRAASKQGAKKR